MYLLYFLCFKQKTAYEMRISDWSSDVCSSDLEVGRLDALIRDRLGTHAQEGRDRVAVVLIVGRCRRDVLRFDESVIHPVEQPAHHPGENARMFLLQLVGQCPVALMRLQMRFPEHHLHAPPDAFGAARNVRLLIAPQSQFEDREEPEEAAEIVAHINAVAAGDRKRA